MKFIYGSGRGGLTRSKGGMPGDENVLGATLSAGDRWLGSGKHGGPIITAAEISLSERFSIMPCFGGKNFFYTFGLDAGACQIALSGVTTVDGGPCDKKATQVSTAVLNYMNAGRASIAENPCDVTIGALAIKGRLVRMTVGTVDSASNLMRVAYSVALPQFLRGGANA